MRTRSCSPWSDASGRESARCSPSHARRDRAGLARAGPAALRIGPRWISCHPLPPNVPFPCAHPQCTACCHPPTPSQRGCSVPPPWQDRHLPRISDVPLPATVVMIPSLNGLQRRHIVFLLLAVARLPAVARECTIGELGIKSHTRIGGVATPGGGGFGREHAEGRHKSLYADHRRHP
jgi:hypothetical protein